MFDPARDPLYDDLAQIQRDRERAAAEFDRQEAEIVALLRAKHTWEDIGRELGVTKQAVQQRYGRLDPHRDLGE